MPENPTFPKPNQILGGNNFPSPNDVLYGDKIEKDPFTLVQEREEKKHALDNIINSVPDIDEGRKDILRDITSRGVKGDDLRDAILTLQGKHHKQSMDGSIKYYLDDKGIPRALANNEKPPKEYRVNSIFGEQSEAEDDNWYTDIAKTAYNILPSSAENVVDFAQTVYEGVADKESEWLNSLKNSANYLKMNKDSDLNKSMYNFEGINEWSDLADTKRLDFSPEAIWGTVNGLLGSVGEFAVGGSAALKGIKAGKGLIEGLKGIKGAVEVSKLGAKAAGATGSVLTNLGEVRDAATEIGLEGRDRAMFVGLVAPVISAFDVKWGLDNKIFQSFVKEDKTAFLKALGKSIPKNAEGKITQEGLDELAKITTVGYAQLAKKAGQLTGKDVLQQGGEEAAQAFAESAGEQLWDKLTSDEKKKFGTDALSPESFGKYIGNFLAGTIGAAPTVVAFNKIKKITKENEQSKTAFGLVQQKEGEDIEATNTRINAYKANIVNEVKQGKLTQEQADNAIFRIDSYKDYNSKLEGLQIDETQKRELFDLTFRKQEIVGELVGEMKGKNLEDMNPIDQAKYKVKEKFATDLQKQINEIVMKAQVKDETVLGEKTIKDVDKLENPPKVEGKPKTKLTNPILQEIADKYKKKPSAETKNYDDVNYDDFDVDDFNKRSFDSRMKHAVTYRHIKKQPNQMVSGVIEKRPFKEGKNEVFETKMSDGKKIRLSSSQRRDDAWKESHLMNVLDETVMKKEGEYMVLDRDKLDKKKVALKAYTINNDGREKKAIKIYNPENGKFIAWAKETHKGVNDYTHQEINGKGGLIDIERTIEIPPTSEGTTVTPIKPQPKGTGNVQVPTKEEYVAQQIEALKDSEEGEYDPTLEETVYKPIIEKQYDALHGKKETKSEVKPTKHGDVTDLLNSAALYNRMSRGEKKSEQGVKLLRRITDDASEIGHSVKFINKGKIQLLNEKGRQVYREARVRSKDAIEREKQDTKETKQALKMTPQSLDHLIIMDVANGETFNIGSINEVGDNAKEVPALMKSNDGGIDIRDYKQRLSEMMGLAEGQDALQGDSDTIAKEAWETLSGYLTDGGRAMAIRDAKDIYEESINEGLTHAEVERLQEENNLTEKEIDVLANVTNNNTEEELTENTTNLETAKDDKTQIKTADEIVASGVEEKTDNPFGDSFNEEEETGTGDIISDPNVDPNDAFQKSSSVAKKEAVEKIVDRLRKFLPKGVKIIYDPKLKAAGKWNAKDKTITINPFLAGSDTPIHEVGHILIDAMGGTSNRVIKAAIEQLRGTALWKETAKNYPLSDTYTKDDLGKEVLAEAIGIEGKGIFDKVAEQNKFQNYLNYIYNRIKQLFGLDKNIAKSLAKQIVSGIKTNKVAQGKDAKQEGEYLELISGFYSPIEKQLKEFKLANQSATKWLNMFGKGDEVTFTGLRAFLEAKKPNEQVKTSEIKDFIKNNRIQIKEVVKGEGTPFAGWTKEDVAKHYEEFTDESSEGKSRSQMIDEMVKMNAEDMGGERGETKFSQYQLEGEKSNYKEVLITIPNKKPTYGEFLKSLGYPSTPTYMLEAQYESQYGKIHERSKNDFKSSHFDEANIVVHLRMNTRTDSEGNKVLFLEEVQSDWGQKGKKEGFKDEQGESWKQADKKYEDFIQKMKSKYGKEWQDELEKSEVDEETKLLDARENTLKGQTPSAPYVTDTNAWAKLGLKVALQHAVQEGATKIAWTTGEQQNERYDLSKQVSKVAYNKETGDLWLTRADNGKIEITNVPQDKLADNVGKELAEKILADKAYFTAHEGVDLKVGGKGMIGFYGSPKEGKQGIIGGVAEKLFGKGSVKTTKIPTDSRYKVATTTEDIKKYSKAGYEFTYNGDSITKQRAYEIIEYGGTQIEAHNKQGEEQYSVDITPEMEMEVGRGLSQFQKPKAQITLDEYREKKGVDLKQEEKDLAVIEAELERENLTDEEIEEIEAIRESILNEIENDQKEYEDFKKGIVKVKKVSDAENLEGFTLDELIEAYHDAKNYDGYADKEMLDAVKRKIGHYFNEAGKDRLRKVDKNIDEHANQRDLTKVEVWMKTLGHMSEDFPALQEFYKIFNQAALDTQTERVDKKSQLEKLGKAVIAEQNKKMGVVGWAKGLFTSNSAKYFEFLDNGKGQYRTDTKGLSKAQIDLLNFMRELTKERQAQDADGNIIENEILKTDKGFRENWKDSGLADAIVNYMGGSNWETEIVVGGKKTTYKDAQKAIITDAKKGLAGKLLALPKLLQIAYKANKAGAKSNYGSLNYNGQLTSKFDQPRSKDKGYSKDFYAAAMSYIDDLTHVKNMGKLVPLIDSIEQFYKYLGFEENKPVGNVLKFIEQWKSEQIYQNTGEFDPIIDKTLQFFRKLTSMTVMGFNYPAGVVNIAIGNYNSWRAEGLSKWSKGQSRFFGGKDRAGLGTVNKKAIDVLNKFGVVSQDFDSNPKMFAGKLFDMLAYGATRFGEYQIQGSMFLGQMTPEEWSAIEYDKDGNITINESKAKMTKAEFDKKMLQYKDRVSDIQGKYNPKDRRNFMRFEGGKAAAQFKVWIPDWFKERYGKEYIDANNVVHRGSWNLFTQQAVADLKQDWAKHNIATAWKNKQVRQNLSGAMAIAVLLIATHSDDEDKKKKRQALSLENALQNLLFVYDPQQLKYLLQSPVASIGTMNKFIDALDAVMHGDSKKAEKLAKKLTPYNKSADAVNYLLDNDKK